MANPTIVLDPIPANLKTCCPSLMPFHISYSGPAAISTFMDIKPAKEDQINPQAQLSSSASTEDNKQASADAVSTDRPAPEAANPEAMCIDSETPSNKAEPLRTGGQGDSGVADLENRDGMGREGEPKHEPTTLAPSPNEANTSSSTSSEKFSETRSISTFRGRTIQGLKVDLPQGFTGLVLQAPAPSTSSSSKATSSKAASSSITKPEEIDETPTSCTRRRGRLTRSAVSKRVIDVEAEEAKKAKEAAAAAVDVDALMDVDNDNDAPATTERDNTPQRRLKPISQFSSITLWHVDNPVIENQDEYYRSIHEWTTLAAALHQGDDEDAAT